MTLRHYAILMLSTCMVFLFLAHATAQDYTTWSLPEGAKARFGKGRVKRMQYSPNGTQLAVATDIGVWVYDANSANSGGLLQLLTGHTYRVNSVVYSPDGHTIASNSWSEIRLWDAATGKHIATLQTNADGSIAYAPDGKTIASTSHEGTIHLWDVDTRQLKTTIRRHTTMVFSIAYSPDGNTIAAASGDKTVSLSDATTGELINTLTGHTDAVSSVAYSPDGSTIISASMDDTVQLWDAATGEHKAALRGHNHYVNSAVYSPDGNTIASRGWDGVFFWALTLGEAKATIKKSVRSIAALAYSPDGNTIAIANVDGTVDLWDAGNAQNNAIPQQKYSLRSFIVGHKRWADQLAYSPDGRTIVCANSSGIHLWNAATGKHIATFKGHTDNLNSVAYSPDGKTIASGSAYIDNSVRLWDTETGEQKNILRATGIVYSIVFSPDGKTIAAGTSGGIYLWSAETARQKTMLTGHKSSVKDIAYSPDGKTLASVGSDGTMLLWDLAGERIQLVGDFNSDGVVNFSDTLPVFFQFIADIILVLKKLGQAMPAPL